MMDKTRGSVWSAVPWHRFSAHWDINQGASPAISISASAFLLVTRLHHFSFYIFNF
jgi:hypothetical protein